MTSRNVTARKCPGLHDPYPGEAGRIRPTARIWAVTAIALLCRSRLRAIAATFGEGAAVDRMVATPDGRMLAVEETGNPGGRPVLVQMGTPNSSRLG
jgi:hypothetical protein